MRKKAKLGAAGRHTHSSDDQFRDSLQRLRVTNLEAVVGILESVILDISQAGDLSDHERKNALRRLLETTLRAASSIPVAKTKPLWKDRDLVKNQTPFDFLAETYAEEIAGHSLSKSDVRRIDYSLYKALASPHWKAKVASQNVFTQLPSKKLSNDAALALLPEGITRGDIIKLLPPEFRELFRLLHLIEVRRHRQS
jgi:hypothetical protein